MIRCTALALVATILLALPARAFLPVEHRQVGDEAMRLALQQWSAAHAPGLSGAPKLRLSPSLELWTGREGLEVGWFSFGELLSIYGDLAVSHEELASPYGKTNAAAFKDIAKTGNFSAHRAVALHFMELASVNETHFAGKAVETYALWHAKALQLAAGGAKNLWEALHYEALALHSYTDLFALGHIMTDRSATMALEAKSAKESAASHALLKRSVSSALKAEVVALKGVRDDVMARYILGFEVAFVHNGYNHWGAQVSNLAGQSFQLFGDHKLGSAPDATKIMQAAAAASIVQILEASQGRPPAAGQANAALRSLPVHYKGAACSVAMSHEKTKVLEALAKQRTKVLTDGGLDAGLLKKQSVPDGSVPYLARVKELCAAACH